MRQKSLVLIVLALTLSISTSGCIDLFHVPGVAVSPDGSRVYFLTEDPERSPFGQLVSAPLAGTIDQTLYANYDELPSAFATHSTTGEVAFMHTNPVTHRTMLEIFNPADGSTRTLITPETFGIGGVGTMMKYSPDGSHLALTLLALPPDLAPETLNAEESELTDEQIAAMISRVYVVNIADASLTEIVPSVATSFNTLSWNASSTQIALNGGADTNGDGKIVIFPTDEPESGVTGDSTNIYVYDVAGNSLTQLTNGLYNYAPAFVGDMLYWVSLSSSHITNKRAKISTTEGILYTTANTITGIAPSPDGTKLAWAEAPGNGGNEELLPGLVYVADNNFANPILMAELPDHPVPDVPVWMPDGQSILITSTNAIAQLVNRYGTSDIHFDLSSTPEASVETETPVIATIVQINIVTGEATPIYTGPVGNSSAYAGTISLVSSDELENLIELEIGVGDTGTE